MKKFLAFALILFVSVNFAFAGTYGVSGGDETATGTVNACGTVIADPLLLNPVEGSIELDDIHPGQAQDWTSSKMCPNKYTVGFSLTSQATYGVSVVVNSLDTDVDGTHVKWAWRYGNNSSWYTSDWGTDGWWRIGAGDDNFIAGSYNDGTLYGQVGIYYWAADAGTHIGDRSFAMTFTLEYDDGL